MSLKDCRLITFPKISDNRGNLTFVESGIHIPFQIKRIYYLYDVPGGETRAGHAHRDLEQVIIAIAGSFDITLDDGFERTTFQHNRSFIGLYFCPMIWREISNFSTGSVCLVLASDVYKEEDYLRDYDSFKRSVGNPK